MQLGLVAITTLFHRFLQKLILWENKNCFVCSLISCLLSSQIFLRLRKIPYLDGLLRFLEDLVTKKPLALGKQLLLLPYAHGVLRLYNLEFLLEPLELADIKPHENSLDRER